MAGNGYGAMAGYPNHANPVPYYQYPQTHFGKRPDLMLSAPPRRKMGLGPALICLLLPCFIFFGISNTMSFGIRYNTPNVSIAASVGCLIAILAVSYLTILKARQAGSTPPWCLLAFASCVLAWILAICVAEYVYTVYMHQYFDGMSMNEYSGVDPATMSGNRLMDGSRLTFVSEARIDVTKSVSFKNIDVYCVAPITIGNATLDNYDFWAVGLNCCDGVGASTGSPATTQFHCGEYNLPQAHSGLRLMREDLRPYYRLAVQDAEATHGIKATHPMFYNWMENPTTEILSYQHAGARCWLTWVGAHFVLQLVLVAVAMPFLS